MDLYGFLWILVWNVWNCLYGFFLWILVRGLAYLFLCVESLFGLVVVLNRGKNCIEKMLGFRGDVVCFFSTHVFVLAITWSSLIQIE